MGLALVKSDTTHRRSHSSFGLSVEAWEPTVILGPEERAQQLGGWMEQKLGDTEEDLGLLGEDGFVLIPYTQSPPTNTPIPVPAHQPAVQDAFHFAKPQQTQHRLRAVVLRGHSKALWFIHLRRPLRPGSASIRVVN